MRRVLACLAAALLASGCLANPPKDIPTDPRVPQQTSNSGIKDPYRTDKTPDTPYEVRKAEKERDDHLAGRTGPTYPPLFKNAKDDGDS